MQEDEEENQAEYAAWVNIEERIVTFCETDGYEKLIFASQDVKFAYVCRLCEFGYRIL